MKRTMYIRRKGFNYYTDYTEKYLHDALSGYGYNLVRERENSVFAVTVYISEEKYMTLQSVFIDMLPEEELPAASEAFSSAFRSEVIISAGGGEPHGGVAYVFYFSDVYSAYDLPPFVESGEPELKQITGNLTPFIPGVPRVYSFVNYGGPAAGLEVRIEGADASDFEDFTVNRWATKNRRITEKPAFERANTGLMARLPDFVIPAGINRGSAVLRGRTLDRERDKRGLYLRLIPAAGCRQEDIKLTICPYGGDEVEVILQGL